MKENRNNVFQWDNLNWPEERIAAVKQEAELFREKCGGTDEKNRFPDGELTTNRGLTINSVITEMIMSPHLVDSRWVLQDPRIRYFQIVEIGRNEYQCKYLDDGEYFWWPMWDKQPHYGFWKDGCSPMRYYVLWEDDAEENMDCDGECVGCDRSCAERILEPEFQEEEGEEYELTIEYTYRMAVTFRAKSDAEAATKAAELSISDKIQETIDMEGNREIDYALCDSAGRTIIDWN